MIAVFVTNLARLLNYFVVVSFRKREIPLVQSNLILFQTSVLSSSQFCFMSTPKPNHSHLKESILARVKLSRNLSSRRKRKLLRLVDVILALIIMEMLLDRC